MADLQALRPLVDTSFKTKVVGGDPAWSELLYTW